MIKIFNLKFFFYFNKLKKNTLFFYIMSNNVSDLTVLTAINDSARESASTSCLDTTAILSEEYGTNIANLAANERLNIAVNDSISKSKLATRYAIERDGINSKEAVERNGIALQLAVANTGSLGLQSTEKNGSSILHKIERTTGEIKISNESIATETREFLAANNVASTLLGKNELLHLCENTDKLTLQADENYDEFRIDVEKTKGHLELTASKDASKIELEAFKLQEEIATNAEECCCELKEEVAKTEYKTQKYARDVESNRIRDQLAVATTEILLKRIKKQCKPKYYKRYPCDPCQPFQPCDPCQPCEPCQPYVQCQPCIPCDPCVPFQPCNPCQPNPCHCGIPT